MFRQAVKRGKMPFNPCTGMDDAHEADPDSNREWLAPEWKFARENAPLEVHIPMMIARYAGLRGQTIVSITGNSSRTIPMDRRAKLFATPRARTDGR